MIDYGSLDVQPNILRVERVFFTEEKLCVNILGIIHSN